jgi:hypothetical protein
MTGLVVAASGTRAGEAKVLVDHELAGAGVSGSEDSKADDDAWCPVSMSGRILRGRELYRGESAPVGSASAFAGAERWCVL